MTELVRQQPRQPYRKYTQEDMMDALEHSRGLIAPAARYLGCKRDTIREYIKEYPEVARTKKDMEEVGKDISENSLLDAAERGEAWAVCFHLKSKAKDRGYGDTLRNEHVGEVKIKLVYDG
jgi:Bacterial regulatory protein, Fis family